MTLTHSLGDKLRAAGFRHSSEIRRDRDRAIQARLRGNRDSRGRFTSLREIENALNRARSLR